MKMVLFIIAAFTVFFLLLWTNVLALLSLISGWRKLSIESPAPETPFPDSVLHKMQFISLGFIRYKYCVNVTFTGAGIIFAAMWPFTFMHKPFIIRWEKISDIKQGEIMGHYVTFAAEGKKITLRGEAASEFEKRTDAGTAGR